MFSSVWAHKQTQTLQIPLAQVSKQRDSTQSLLAPHARCTGFRSGLDPCPRNVSVVSKVCAVHLLPTPSKSLRSSGAGSADRQHTDSRGFSCSLLTWSLSTLGLQKHEVGPRGFLTAHTFPGSSFSVTVRLKTSWMAEGEE